MKVDKSWFMSDTGTGLLVLQRLGFFGDNHLKRTINSNEIWRNIALSTPTKFGATSILDAKWGIFGHGGGRV